MYALRSEVLNDELRVTEAQDMEVGMGWDNEEDEEVEKVDRQAMFEWEEDDDERNEKEGEEEEEEEDDDEVVDGHFFLLGHFINQF